MTKKQFNKFSEIGQWGIANLCVDKVEEIINAGEHKGIIQVEIKINGVEVDFETIMSSLESQYEEAVMREAKNSLSKIVSDKIADITNVLCDIENQAECLQQDLELTVGF